MRLTPLIHKFVCGLSNGMRSHADGTQAPAFGGKYLLHLQTLPVGLFGNAHITYLMYDVVGRKQF